MPDPTPPPGDCSPSGPCRAARQDHAVLAWLVVEADVPEAVHGHLVDALVAWAPLMGEHLFPTEPEVVLNEVRGRVNLAMQALRARRTPAPALPEPRSPGG